MKKIMSRYSLASVSLAMAFLAASVNGFAQSGSDTQLVYQLQQLQDEIRELRGLVEQQAFELENLKRRQRDQYLDLDQRLTQASTGIAAGNNIVADNANTTASVSSAPEQPQIGQDVPEVRQPLVVQRTVTSVPLPTTSSAAVVAASPAEEKAGYDNAFSALKDLRYAESAQAFLDFIELYPNSEYADNAQYWLGESFYAAGNYDLALNAFNGLLSNYHDSSKTADALLKIGYSHYEKKEWPQARAALEQVKAQYPETTLSRLAESRLRNMRLEGHF